MIDCLTGFVGLRGVTDSPSSGLYINELPGITTEQFELTRSQELGVIEEEWNAIENTAIRGFEQDLKFHLRKYFKNHSIIYTNSTGYIDSNEVLNHGDAYSGILIDLYGQSQNLKVSIENVKMYLPLSDNFNIKIFDANTGIELFTTSVTGVSGLNTVKVNREFAVFNHNRLFICYDTVSPLKMQNTNSQWFSSGYTIPTSSDIITDNMTSSDVGLSVNYSVKCGIDEFVCNRLSLFQEPFIYRLGLEFLKTSKYSDRINRYTLLGKERRDEMMMDFQDEYEKSITAAFADLQVNDDGICFICNKAITKKVLIP